MKKVIVILASAAAIFSASSCAKQLEVAPPNAIYDEQIIEILNGTDEAKKQLVLNAVASPFAKYFNLWGSPMPGGVLAPMTYCYQGIEQARSLQGNDMVFGLNENNVNDLAGTSYYKGTINFSGSDSEGNKAHWFGYAYAINQANLLLGYMTKEAAKGSASATDGRIRGLLVRGYSYMCLAEEYCKPYKDGGAEGVGLPLYSEYNPGQAAVAPSTLKATWDFILADLKEAVDLAGNNFTTDYDKLEDFDAGLANFLYARACLLTGDYANAILACDKIIGSTKYSFIDNDNYGCNSHGDAIAIDTQFLPTENAFTNLKKNPETIYGYVITSSYNPRDGANRSAVQTMLQNPFGSYSSGGSTVRMDGRLYSKITGNDIRKNAFYPKEFDYMFYGATTKKVVPSHAAMKFGATVGLNTDGTTSDGSLVDYQEFCKFRYSEVILMKAEAQAMSGQSPDALDLLLAARSIDKKNPMTTANVMAELKMTDKLAFVQLQWRIEMWGENGREYFNNKRWHVNVDRTGEGSTHWQKDAKLTWEQMILEIPKEEIQNNPNW